MKWNLAALLLLPACAAPAAQTESAATLSPEQAWLQQLVGEWHAVSEAHMGPDTPPMRVEATEVVRPVGANWIVAETHAELQGAPMHSQFTLGHDPARQSFVGTWVDNMQTHLWIYEGVFDASETLVLETQGPDWEKPGELARYRDSWKVLDWNHKTLESSVLGANGQWNVFLRAQYRRVR